MYFTSSIAIAILAFTSSSLAAPAQIDNANMNMMTMTTVTRSSTGVSAYPPYSTSAPSNSSNYGSATTYAPPTYSSSIASSSASAPGTPPPAATAIPAPAPAPSASASANPFNMSKTQQLFIADTAVDRFALLSDADLKFDFNDPEGKQAKANKGNGGRIIKADRKTFPALVSTGAGMAVGFLGPCGFNTPHVHPRSVELQVVTKGKLMVEMLPENGVVLADGKTRRVIQNEVGENQMTPFYMGSVHTQYNPTCDNATFVAAFNNEDFGAGTIAEELMAFDSNIVTAAFGEAISGADVEKFRGAIPPTIAKGVEQCLMTCNMPKNSA